MRKTKTADFDYHLPPELIAQKPFFPRDQCRLMVLDKKRGDIQHRRFFNVVDYLRQGDVLVLNNSKVFKARLYGGLSLRPRQGGGSNPVKAGDRHVASLLAMTDKKVEIFLLRKVSFVPPLKVRGGEGELCKDENVWQVLANPGRKLKPGAKVYFSQKVWCEVIDKNNDKYLVRFNITGDKFWQFVSRYGHVPVPPYIKQEPKNLEEYQTVYAKSLGSVAAPTAGFHFTKKLLARLRRQGVEICYLTLHVGYGTFKPIKSEYIKEHKMEPEWVEISKAVAEEINRAKKEKRRIIAVGTTTVRALEGIARACHCERNGVERGNPIENGIASSSDDRRSPRNDIFYSGEVNLFITPGFKFRIIDALITNFHLPKSTLLLLVSALGGEENIHRAYQEAIGKMYRFYSFGDAMLII